MFRFYFEEVPGSIPGQAPFSHRFTNSRFTLDAATMFLPGCFGILFLRRKGPGYNDYDPAPPLYSENKADDVLVTIERTLDVCSPALRQLSLSIHSAHSLPVLSILADLPQNIQSSCSTKTTPMISSPPSCNPMVSE